MFVRDEKTKTILSLEFKKAISDACDGSFPEARKCISVDLRWRLLCAHNSFLSEGVPIFNSL